MGDSRFFFFIKLLALASLISCARPPAFETKNAEAGLAVDNERAGDDADDSTNWNSGGGGIYQLGRLEFQQPLAQTIVSKLDLLFVMDTSASMDDKKEAISNGLVQFVSRLPADSDINLSLLLAHGQSQWAGKLYQRAAEPVVLRSVDLSPSELSEQFFYKLTEAPSEAGSSGEFSLGALKLLLSDQENKELAMAQGFLREDAALVVVFVSDENDICTFTDELLYQLCFSCSANSERQWGQLGGGGFCYESQDKAFVQYENFFDEMKSISPSPSLSLAGIIYTGSNPVPVVSQTSVGYGIREVVEASGGFLIDLGNPPGEPVSPPNSNRISNAMGDFGDYARQIVENSNQTFQLPQSQNILASSINIKVNAQDFDFTYDAIKKQVTLSLPSLGGAHIIINYQYQI